MCLLLADASARAPWSHVSYAGRLVVMAPLHQPRGRSKPHVGQSAVERLLVRCGQVDRVEAAPGGVSPPGPTTLGGEVCPDTMTRPGTGHVVLAHKLLNVAHQQAAQTLAPPVGCNQDWWSTVHKGRTLWSAAQITRPAGSQLPTGFDEDGALVGAACAHDVHGGDEGVPHDGPGLDRGRVGVRQVHQQQRRRQPLRRPPELRLAVEIAPPRALLLALVGSCHELPVPQVRQELQARTAGAPRAATGPPGARRRPAPAPAPRAPPPPRTP